jgi:hypothetical protein
MMEKLIKLIVGFDGIHRAGKGTQISLLRDSLNGFNGLSVVARGDGTRRGINSSNFDYNSSWWAGRWDYFHSKMSRELALFNLNLRFQRLNREAKVLYHSLEKKMKIENKDLGLLLLDRTLPSRYATMRYFYPDISFEDSIKSINPKNNRDVYPIMPDIVFILHAPKDILLRRLEDSTEEGEDYHCKFEAINNYGACVCLGPNYEQL